MSAKHTPGPWRIDEDRDDMPIVGRPTWGCKRFGVVGEWEVAAVEDLDEEHEEERLANARLIAAAPELLDAVGFSRAALEALKGYEADCGEPLPDDHELGRIDDSRHSPSFRIRVGHIRRLAAALAKAEGRQ